MLKKTVFRLAAFILMSCSVLSSARVVVVRTRNDYTREVQAFDKIMKNKVLDADQKKEAQAIVSAMRQSRMYGREGRKLQSKLDKKLQEQAVQKATKAQEQLQVVQQERDILRDQEKKGTQQELNKFLQSLNVSNIGSAEQAVKKIEERFEKQIDGQRQEIAQLKTDRDDKKSLLEQKSKAYDELKTQKETCDKQVKELASNKAASASSNAETWKFIESIVGQANMKALQDGSTAYQKTSDATLRSSKLATAQADFKLSSIPEATMAGSECKQGISAKGAQDAQISALKKANESLTSKNTSVQADLDQEKNKLAACVAEKTRLESANEDLKKQKTELDVKAQRFEDSYKKEKQDKEQAVKAKEEGLSSVRSDYEQKIAALTKERDNLISKLRAAESRADVAEGQDKQDKASLTDVREELQKAKQDVAQLNKQVKEREESIQERDRTLAELRETIARREKTIAEQAETIEHYKREQQERDEAAVIEDKSRWGW